MAIAQALCSSFKKELLEATHDFNASGGNTFKLALYTSSASLSAATTVYSTSGEVTGTGYTAGGKTLTKVDPAVSGTVGFVDFSNISWTTATFTARGALIYNSTNGNKAVAVLDFGGDKDVSIGTFAISFPTPSSTSAIIRIA
jgi:hypothetical protein